MPMPRSRRASHSPRRTAREVPGATTYCSDRRIAVDSLWGRSDRREVLWRVPRQRHQLPYHITRERAVSSRERT